MATYWPENIPSDRRTAIDELLKGRDYVNQLKLALTDQSINGEEGSEPADDLVTKILNTFTSSLSILKRAGEFDEESQGPASTVVGSGWDGCRKSEESGESSKSTCRIKERRGCYKRRKTCHSWTRETPEVVDDGHAWRKYGQKVILKAKYQRSYYRCTHKFDQGCQATKQVQRIQEEPPMYRTTYYGNHTCKNHLKDSLNLILDDPETNDDKSILINFTTKQNNNNNNNLFPSSFASSSSSIKKESKDEAGSPNYQSTSHTQPSLSHYLIPTHGHGNNSLSKYDHQAADLISGDYSSSSTSTTREFDLDLDFIENSVNGSFDDEDVFNSLAYFDS